MKKRILLISVISIMLVAMLFCLTGCTKTKSFTYDVSTGEKIELKLKTDNGYDITSNIPFAIKKDDKTILQGSFITEEGYNQYIALTKTVSGATILDSGEKNGAEYTFYKYEYPGQDTEYNFIVKVKKSKTGVLIGSTASEKEAKEAFERLNFSKVD